MAGYGDGRGEESQETAGGSERKLDYKTSPKDSIEYWKGATHTFSLIYVYICMNVCAYFDLCSVVPFQWRWTVGEGSRGWLLLSSNRYNRRLSP